MKSTMLRRLLRSLGMKKNAKTIEYFNYTKEQLMQHLEKQFQPGMTWSNYGEWHIDHIIPVSFLISKGLECPCKINALINLRPLSARDNHRKQSALIPSLINRQLIEFYGLTSCN